MIRAVKLTSVDNSDEVTAEQPLIQDEDGSVQGLPQELGTVQIWPWGARSRRRGGAARRSLGLERWSLGFRRSDMKWFEVEAAPEAGWRGVEAVMALGSSRAEGHGTVVANTVART